MIFAEHQHLNLDKNKNDRFNIIEKQRKSCFCLQFLFYWNLRLQTQKSTFTEKFSPSPSLEVIFFLLLFIAGAELQCTLILVHTDLASIFNIMTAMHAGKKPECLAAFYPSSLIFHIYTKSTATLTYMYHRNFSLVVFFSGHKFQNMPW